MPNFIRQNMVAIISLAFGVASFIFNFATKTATAEGEIKVIHERIDSTKAKLSKNIDKTNELAERVSKIEGQLNVC